MSDGPEVILGQNCVRFSDTVLNDLFFFKNLFYQEQCEYAMNIVFYREKVPFYISPSDAAFNF